MFLTGQLLRASYLFSFFWVYFYFIRYFFLTRTVSDTSVHAFFTEAGKAINVMDWFVPCSHLCRIFRVRGPAISYHYKKIPTIYKEEQTSSREFDVPIHLYFFFNCISFIIAKPLYQFTIDFWYRQNSATEDAEFSQ